MSSEKIKKIFDKTMNELTNQIRMISNTINRNDIVYLIDLILQIRNTSNKIFVYGAGRSGFIGRCFAQRLMHFGINSCFISDAIIMFYCCCSQLEGSLWIEPST